MSVEPSTPQPWRDRKRLQTRVAVVQAALELFAEDGFDRVTVDRIAERAQIAPRTFFRYFASKEDVLFADDDELLARLLESLRRQPTAVAPLAAVLAASQALAAGLQPRLSELAEREHLLAQTPSLRARDLAKRARWQDEIAVLIAAGWPRRGSRDVQLIAGVAMACWQVAYGEWLREQSLPLPKCLERAYAALPLVISPTEAAEAANASD